MIYLEEYKQEDFRDLKGNKPIFPLKNGGKIYFPGWEIPLTWLLDSSGKVWIDGTFGEPPFTLISKEKLLLEEKDSSKKETLRVSLGMKPLRPEWMTKALKEGWTPPEGWIDPEKSRKKKK